MNSKQCLSTISLTLTFFMAGCSPRIDHHGKLPEPENLKQLKIGVDTQEDVLRSIGSPTTVSVFDPMVWLYVHRTTETSSFLTPKVLDQKQVIVSFDTKGILKNITIQEKETDIQPSSDKTPSPGFEPTWLQQIFGNYGRFAKKGKTD